MGFFDKIKNRYNIIGFVLIVLILGLAFRLAVLTIAQGDYYWELSNNKRYKEVYTSAPRGEIRDRNGLLLAGNKPSFTVKLFKDEINLFEKKEKNEAFIKLMRLMEEDGVNYVDEFPIELNVFKYKAEEDYKTEELSPTDKVIEIIEDNNLIRDVLKSYYVYDGYEEHFKFITANRAVNALKYKGIDMPINIELKSNKVKMTFNENHDIKSWKEELNIEEDLSPLDSLISLIGDDKTIIRKIISNSLSRELIYNILEKNNLLGNLIKEDFSITYMEDYLNMKRSLNRDFPEITLESEAIDDFAIMFTQRSLYKFLQRIIYIDNEEEEGLIIPAEILIEMLRNKGIDVAIDLKIIEEEDTIIFENLTNKKIDEDKTIKHLIKISSEADIIKEFLSRDEIRLLAQSQLLNDGVNPKIGVSQEFQYVDIRNLNDFYKVHGVKDATPIDTFFQVLKENYEIDKGLSDYESRGILVLYNQVQKQGYLAYQPIYIAYGLKESTVASIEEGLMDFEGIEVAIEGVRYYPEGTTMAHMLGYLGKISQTNEIKKYIDEKNYFRGAIIGKTGVEESFEDILSGTYGIKKIEVDSVGNTTRLLEEVKAIPGDNLYLSLDLELQKIAEKALEDNLLAIQTAGVYESKWGNYKIGINTKKRRPYKNATSGAIVAIDVKTGQVLASASYPAYDPNLFSTGISNSDWASLIPDDERDHLAPRPLYNIVTQTAIQPGSIYKLVTALTALDKGLSPNKKIRDMGYVNLGRRTMQCHLWSSGRTHGYVDVYEAIRDSCNYYFYSLAYGRNPRTGEHIGVKIEIEDIAEMATQLGLNDRTGIEINIPAEVATGVPDPQRKILGQKNILRNFLRTNIEKYFEEDFEYDLDYKQEVIEEIVSWSDEEIPLSRGEVIKKLSEMQIMPEFRHDGERAGIADQIKFDHLDYAGWNISDTLNVTIGQGLNSYTPIQMANYIATIVNGGNRHTLSLVDSIKNYNNSETKYAHKPNSTKIDLNDPTDLEHIMKGMLLVSKSGTSSRAYGRFPVQVLSKTGTAEREGINPITGDTYDDFAWSVAAAPHDDPQIAVAAVVFQGGTGSNTAPMIREVLAQYLGLND